MSRTHRQWNLDTAGPVSRWFLRHVWLVPGGLQRFLGVALFICTLGLAGLSIYLWNDETALQSDREFFPFITVFFGIISLLLLLVSFLIRRLAKRRARNAPPPQQPPGPWAGPADPYRNPPTPQQHPQQGPPDHPQHHPQQHPQQQPPPGPVFPYR